MSSPTAEPNSLPRYVAIVDTNVLVDLYTPTDLLKTYGSSKWEGVDSTDSVYRRSRARESLLFALYLHESRATTLSLHDEPIAKLIERVPPRPDEIEGALPSIAPVPREPTGETVFASNFLRVFLHFVKSTLLSRWDDKSSLEAGAQSGNRADVALLWMAYGHGSTLVTNEGNASTSRPNSRSLRAKGERVGVRVKTPLEFVPPTFDFDRAIDRFFAALYAKAPAYIAGDDVTEEFMAYMSGYYRHVLLGETRGRSRVAVSVSR
jgi:hypothetical protein